MTLRLSRHRVVPPPLPSLGCEDSSYSIQDSSYFGLSPAVVSLAFNLLFSQEALVWKAFPEAFACTLNHLSRDFSIQRSIYSMFRDF